MEPQYLIELRDSFIGAVAGTPQIFNHLNKRLVTLFHVARVFSNIK